MTSWLSRNLCFSLIVRVAELHLATIGSSRGSRTYLSIPHGRDRGYFGAGLGAEDAVYLMYTRTKVTTPCAEIARSRRVADQSRSRTAEQCLRAQRVGATRERAMRAATMREPLHASAVASPQAGPLLRAAARRLRCGPPCQAFRLGRVGTPSIHPVLATTRLTGDVKIGSGLARPEGSNNHPAA